MLMLLQSLQAYFCCYKVCITDIRASIRHLRGIEHLIKAFRAFIRLLRGHIQAIQGRIVKALTSPFKALEGVLTASKSMNQLI
jgi:hypothetical protein